MDESSPLDDASMRQRFPGHYRPTAEEFSELWEKALFVPDANVLLNLYRYSEATRKALLEIFEAVGDRLWVAYQTAYEFQVNRLGVIQQQADAYVAFEGTIDSIGKQLTSQAEVMKRHPIFESGALKAKANTIVNGLKKFLKEAQERDPGLFTTSEALVEDPIRSELDSLLEGRVGEPFEAERLNAVFQEGRDRFEAKRPPGYRDEGKGDTRQYGDLVFWKQVMEKAKSAGRPIILITDERKDDWWWEFGGQTLGPRPELVAEMMDEAGVRFYLYPARRFMEEARGYLQRAVSEEAIEEVERLQRSSEAEGEIDVRETRDIVDWLSARAEGVEEKGYTSEEAAAIAGITYRQLDYWDRTRLVRPSIAEARGMGTRRLYSFDDLLRLRAIKRLAERGVSLQRIRRAIDSFEEVGDEELHEDNES
jgi:hypothetical protein